MTFWEFLKDKIMLLLLHLLCMLGSAFYLSACGLRLEQLLLFYMAWTVMLLGYLLATWYKRSRYFKELYQILDGLDKPYLLGETAPYSWRLEDKLYQDLLKRSNKSVIDAIHHLETECMEYKDFIENWIHEVKLPLTSMNLMCDNRSENVSWTSKDIRRLKASLSELENDIDKALYYARSDTVYQDYMIRRISLHEVIVDVIRHLKPYLIQNHVQLELSSDLEETSVYCDNKWLSFILNQILLNSVKYKKDEGCHIQIRSKQEPQKTILSIEDNGIGIRPEDLGRIFEKGFTGNNGRKDGREQRQSTGIGLYLCKKLSRKLGITLEAESEPEVYTRILLIFPDGSSHFSKGNLSKS
ncbi:MAG: sensor histidine kinase [Faecalicatena sp.]|uniref:sensor histidine kinase n=1 Tax=Faecalicatena sp. TaxID=2005360 RepID=UPI00258910D7|nr:sensor histidine kinase [Faecalicatena sp.]MCI6465593.1 sensor histidine kinase [Faecalicatena sp.]MDY5617425.1 sensor histidine kinase [Lachnospiraceae bacterium]